MNNIYRITFAIIGLFVSISAQEPVGGSNGGHREGRRERPVIIVPSRDTANMMLSGPAELRCRGGNGLGFRPVGSGTHSSGAAMTRMELSFSPSSPAAGPNSAGLQPGECAFADRAFYLDEVGQVREPLKVRFETPANAQLKQTQSGGSVDRSSTRAESYPDESSIPEYLRNPDRYWSFYVSNTGQGYFAASGHHHWKPRVEAVKMRKPGSMIMFAAPRP